MAQPGKENLSEENLSVLERLEKAALGDAEEEMLFMQEGIDFVQHWLTEDVEVRKVEIVTGGAFIKYIPLTYGEILSIQKIEDEGDRRFESMFNMLKKAYPEMSREDLKSMPANTITLIQARLAADDNRFLFPGLNKLYASLTKRLMRRTSGLSSESSDTPSENLET